mmetsp:Transcript_29995/g.75946  ORF Transcript_29995/g.75946 Transcript_29995/m.75946 type:complete len:245 (-) Transcript_29995:26-760(-)
MAMAKARQGHRRGPARLPGGGPGHAPGELLGHNALPLVLHRRPVVGDAEAPLHHELRPLAPLFDHQHPPLVLVVANLVTLDFFRPGARNGAREREEHAHDCAHAHFVPQVFNHGTLVVKEEGGGEVVALQHFDPKLRVRLGGGPWGDLLDDPHQRGVPEGPGLVHVSQVLSRLAAEGSPGAANEEDDGIVVLPEVGRQKLRADGDALLDLLEDDRGDEAHINLPAHPSSSHPPSLWPRPVSGVN